MPPRYGMHDSPDEAQRAKTMARWERRGASKSTKKQKRQRRKNRTRRGSRDGLFA